MHGGRRFVAIPRVNQSLIGCRLHPQEGKTMAIMEFARDGAPWSMPGGPMTANHSLDALRSDKTPALTDMLARA